MEESHWGQVGPFMPFIELVHINASKYAVFAKIKQKVSVRLKTLLIKTTDTAMLNVNGLLYDCYMLDS